MRSDFSERGSVPRGSRHKLRQWKFQLDMRENVFHYEGGKALEEAAQQGCVSPSIHSLTGHSPLPPGQRGGVGPDVLQRPLPTQVTLWFFVYCLPLAMAITLGNIIVFYIYFPPKYLSINPNTGNTSLLQQWYYMHVQSHINRLRLFLLTVGSSKNLQTFPETWLSPHNLQTKQVWWGHVDHSSSRSTSDYKQKSFLLHLWWRFLHLFGVPRKLVPWACSQHPAGIPFSDTGYCQQINNLSKVCRFPLLARDGEALSEDNSSH